MSNDFREQAIEAMAKAMFDRHAVSGEYSYNNQTKHLFVKDARDHLDALAAFMERENVKALKRDVGFPKIDGKTAHEMRGLVPDVWATLHDALPCLLQPTEPCDG